MGFDTVDPILDFLNNKSFKLKRKGKSNLFESWSRGMGGVKWYMDPHDREYNSFDPSKPKNKKFGLGLMFSHKFMPDEIILYLGSRSLDPKLAKMINREISFYSAGIANRSPESEVLIDSYKANTIALCKNVKRFALSMKTFKREPVVYEALMGRLDNPQDKKALKRFYEKSKYDYNIVTASCNRSGSLKIME